MSLFIWRHLVPSFTKTVRMTVETEDTDLHWSGEILPTYESVYNNTYCNVLRSAPFPSSYVVILYINEIYAVWIHGMSQYFNLPLRFDGNITQLSVSLNVSACIYEVFNTGWYWRKDSEPDEPNAYPNLLILI